MGLIGAVEESKGERGQVTAMYRCLTIARGLGDDESRLCYEVFLILFPFMII